jgi:hypothetical protein
MDDEYQEAYKEWLRGLSRSELADLKRCGLDAPMVDRQKSRIEDDVPNACPL